MLAHPPCPMFRHCPRPWSLTRQLTLHETTYQQSLLSACRSKHEFLNTRKSSTDIILSRNNWSLLSTAFVMLHLVSGINFLYLFINLILVPVPQFLTHLFLHPSLLPHLIHHSDIQTYLSFTHNRFQLLSVNVWHHLASSATSVFFLR